MSEPKDEKQDVEEKPTPEPVIEDVNSNENPGAEKIDESFSEKANQFADKSAEVAEKIFDNLKKGFSQAFDTGSKWAGELNQLAHEYAEKYNNYMEVSKLTKQKNDLTAKIGKFAYNQYKTDQKLPEDFLKQEKVAKLLKEINAVDQEIIKAGEKIEAEK